jgi:hypothetical protein
MRKPKLSFQFCVILAGFAIFCLMQGTIYLQAQPQAPQTIIKGLPPTGAGGACVGTPRIGYLATTGVMYTCKALTWQSVSSGAAGPTGATGATGPVGAAPFSCTVTSVSSIACTHNLNTSNPWVTCYDNQSPPQMLGSTGAATSVSSIIATTANVATIGFSGTTTGVCLISTGSAGPAGATGTTGTTGSTGATGATGASASVTFATPGTSFTLTGTYGIGVCTGTCTVTVPVPVAGAQFCVWNGDNVSTAITLSALGSSAMYENSARTAYGTAGTGTLVVAAAVKNKVCIFGYDATHYHTISNDGGTITVN